MLDEIRSLFLVIMGLPAVVLAGFVIFQFAWGVLELTGPEMTPEAHAACTLHAESNTHIATSCGVVAVPDELRDQLESDGPYDIVAEQSDGGVVAMSVTPAAED